MLGHVTRSRRLHTTHSGGHSATHTSTSPRMRQRAPAAKPTSWSRPQRANYYFDATWHTAQTLRRLIRTPAAAGELGPHKPARLLVQSMDTLLDSICPGLVDDGESHDYFHQLLQAHLSGLDAAELAQLAKSLKQQRYSCAVVESVIDDVMIKDYGFANGPPHRHHRTLMFTRDLYHALEAAQDAAATAAGRTDDRRLTPAQARGARDALAALATRPAHAEITLTELVGMAARLAHAIGLAEHPSLVIAATPMPSPVSAVDWQDEHLIVDLQTFVTVCQARQPGPLAALLRDLLELLLARRLIGPGANLATLPAAQRALLLRALEQVISAPPAIADRAAPARAADILRRSDSFGAVQICPTSGVRLGHAWIAPVLSLMPDKSRPAREIGTRFMRTGFRLEPAHCTISEWKVRWLSATESDSLYPSTSTWQVRVPVDRHKLQQAATEVVDEWMRKALPYRFIDTQPGMPTTGCRATVLQAVQRAMDDDTRTLFEHFMLGLPEPESPTELALRLEQFMEWLTTLAAQNERADL